MRSFKLAVATIVLSLAASAAEMPKSVLHIITLRYKPGTTDAQKEEVKAATISMTKQFPGITRLWFKKVKVQVEGMTDIMVMEFKDQAAFDAYGPHPAHKAWEKVYLPLRDASNTQDVSN